MCLAAPLSVTWYPSAGRFSANPKLSTGAFPLSHAPMLEGAAGVEPASPVRRPHRDPVPVVKLRLEQHDNDDDDGPGQSRWTAWDQG